MDSTLIFFELLKEYANAIVAIAALLAVLIGPSIQAFGAIRQGRSQAISNLSTALVTETVHQISKIILLASEYRNSDRTTKNEIIRKIYQSETAVILIMGQSTKTTRNLESSLHRLREYLQSNEDGQSIEQSIGEIKKIFYQALSEERKNIRAGK